MLVQTMVAENRKAVPLGDAHFRVDLNARDANQHILKRACVSLAHLVAEPVDGHAVIGVA
jgi:hypothetical protein